MEMTLRYFFLLDQARSLEHGVKLGLENMMRASLCNNMLLEAYYVPGAFLDTREHEVYFM